MPIEARYHEQVRLLVSLLPFLNDGPGGLTAQAAFPLRHRSARLSKKITSDAGVT